MDGKLFKTDNPEKEVEVALKLQKLHKEKIKEFQIMISKFNDFSVKTTLQIKLNVLQALGEESEKLNEMVKQK